MQTDKCGYGAGQRELKPGPNLLRIILGHRNPEPADLPEGFEADQVWILETAIDDMSPELIGFCVERLFEDGALDVALLPIYMKKNRPATQVQVICRQAHKEALLHRIFTETSTLGVRLFQSDRRLLVREEATIATTFGKIAVKRIQLPGGGYRIVPEYEVCRKIALEKNLPLQTIYDKIASEVSNNGDT